MASRLSCAHRPEGASSTVFLWARDLAGMSEKPMRQSSISVTRHYRSGAINPSRCHQGYYQSNGVCLPQSPDQYQRPSRRCVQHRADQRCCPRWRVYCVWTLPCSSVPTQSGITQSGPRVDPQLSQITGTRERLALSVLYKVIVGRVLASARHLGWVQVRLEDHNLRAGQVAILPSLHWSQSTCTGTQNGQAKQAPKSHLPQQCSRRQKWGQSRKDHPLLLLLRFQFLQCGFVPIRNLESFPDAGDQRR